MQDDEDAPRKEVKEVWARTATRAGLAGLKLRLNSTFSLEIRERVHRGQENTWKQCSKGFAYPVQRRFGHELQRGQENQGPRSQRRGENHARIKIHTKVEWITDSATKSKALDPKEKIVPNPLVDNEDVDEEDVQDFRTDAIQGGHEQPTKSERNDDTYPVRRSLGRELQRGQENN